MKREQNPAADILESAADTGSEAQRAYIRTKQKLARLLAREFAPQIATRVNDELSPHWKKAREAFESANELIERLADSEELPDATDDIELPTIDGPLDIEHGDLEDNLRELLDDFLEELDDLELTDAEPEGFRKVARHL